MRMTSGRRTHRLSVAVTFAASWNVSNSDIIADPREFTRGRYDVADARRVKHRTYGLCA